MKEDNHYDKILGKKLASYEEMPEKLTFSTVHQNYLKQNSAAVKSKMSGKIAIAIVSIVTPLALLLMAGDHTMSPTQTKMVAGSFDTSTFSEGSSSSNNHSITAREKEHTGAMFPIEENFTGAGERSPGFETYDPKTLNVPNKEIEQKKNIDSESMKQRADAFQPGISRSQEFAPAENKNSAVREYKAGKQSVDKSPEFSRSMKQSAAQPGPAQQASPKEKKENFHSRELPQNNLEGTAVGTVQDPQAVSRLHGKENIHESNKNSSTILPASGKDLSDGIQKSDRVPETKYPEGSERTSLPMLTDQQADLKNAENIPAENHESSRAGETGSIPPGEKTGDPATATVAAQNTAVAAPAVKADFPPSPHRFSLSSELTWNALTSKLSANTAGSDHNDAQGFIAEQSQMKTGVINGSILFGYMYKNTGVNIGAGLLQFDNHFNSRSFAKTEDLYEQKINTSTSITTSVIVSTTIIPGRDTVPPVVTTVTTITTVTVTKTDTVNALVGKRTYAIVNGDTVSPGDYVSSARFFYVPLRFSYAFPVLDNRLIIEPGAGVNFCIPLASQQLVLEKDRRFSYIKTRLPFNNFIMLDGSLKISYRMGRNASVYLKQGVAMSGKNIYKKDYPLVYKISNIYSTFGLSLMFN